MPKFRKRPVVIEAEQWFPTNGSNPTFAPKGGYAWNGQVYADEKSSTGFSIDTLEGKHEVTPGDWIITGVKGEKYPCKPDIFALTYDAIGELSSGRAAVAVDFDGVIHKYSKGYHDGTCYDEAMPGALQGLRNLMERYNVFILSTRNPEQIQGWMASNLPTIPTQIITSSKPFWDVSGVVGITNRKLAAIAYIDDRAVPFDTWEKTKVTRKEK